MLQQLAAIAALDQQHTLAGQSVQLRMLQETFRIEARCGLHGYPVAFAVERARCRGADHRERQIALLSEQLGAEAHGVRARKNDQIVCREGANVRRHGAAVKRLDLQCRETQGLAPSASSNRHSGIA